jgi:threonine synthase
MLPPRIAGLFDREERYQRLPADLEAIEGFIAERAVPAG